MTKLWKGRREVENVLDPGTNYREKYIIKFLHIYIPGGSCISSLYFQFPEQQIVVPETLNEYELKLLGPRNTEEEGTKPFHVRTRRQLSNYESRRVKADLRIKSVPL